MNARARKSSIGKTKYPPAAAERLILRSRRGLLRVGAGANDACFGVAGNAQADASPPASPLIRALWDDPKVEYQA